MANEREHLRFNRDGSLAGLYVLDASKATGSYWDCMEQIVMDYTKIHPEEMREAVAQNEWDKGHSIDEFGSTGQKGDARLRRLIAVPNGLLIAIMAFDPEFLESGKRLYGFAKRFPGLSAATRI
jgi:hypothetical protein